MRKENCPECGESLDNIEWEDDIRETIETVEYVGYCSNCGHEFRDVYTLEGIYDEENDEYIKKYP